MTTYSNPRTHAVIDNWPMGGSRRGTAIFDVETDPKRGQRGVRITVDPKRGTSAPKKLTYARAVRIVDGDDGKTYFAELASMYGFITIMQGNAQFQAETVYISDPRWPDLMRLLDQSEAAIEAWQLHDERQHARYASA